VVTRGKVVFRRGKSRIVCFEGRGARQLAVDASHSSGHPNVLETNVEFACVSVTLPLSKPLHVNIRAAVCPAQSKQSPNNN